MSGRPLYSRTGMSPNLPRDAAVGDCAPTIGRPRYEPDISSISPESSPTRDVSFSTYCAQEEIGPSARPISASGPLKARSHATERTPGAVVEDADSVAVRGNRT